VTDRVGRLRAFFIGGGPELIDPADAGPPPLPPAGPAGVASRYGMATRSAGAVRVRFSVSVQGPPPPPPAASAATSAAAARAAIRGGAELRGGAAGPEGVVRAGARDTGNYLRRRRATAAAAAAAVMAVAKAAKAGDEPPSGAGGDGDSDTASRIRGRS
jgi:hypothetical protein